MNIPENILSTLTDEQKKAVEEAQTPEDLIAVAKKAGYELSPDQLETVAGGKWCYRGPFCSHGSCKEECAPYDYCADLCLRVSK